MARTNTDTIIGIVGAVAIVFALVGIFVYEYNNVDEDDMDDVEPPIASERFDGSLAADGSATETFLPGEGVTAMEVAIQWTPTAPGVITAAATYTYELTGPDGEVIASDTASETVTITVPNPVGADYTLTLSAASPSQGGDYVAEASYDY